MGRARRSGTASRRRAAKVTPPAFGANQAHGVASGATARWHPSAHSEQRADLPSTRTPFRELHGTPSPERSRLRRCRHLQCWPVPFVRGQAALAAAELRSSSARTTLAMRITFGSTRRGHPGTPRARGRRADIAPVGRKPCQQSTQASLDRHGRGKPRASAPSRACDDHGSSRSRASSARPSHEWVALLPAAGPSATRTHPARPRILRPGLSPRRNHHEQPRHVGLGGSAAEPATCHRAPVALRSRAGTCGESQDA